MSTDTRAPSESGESTPAAFGEGLLADPKLRILRGITRQMATAEHLDTVLASIVDALGEHDQALLARIFLLMEDRECAICRQRIEAGEHKPTTERRLHLVAERSNTPMSSGVFHIAPVDSRLPAAEMVRNRRSFLVEDWRTIDQFVNDPRIAPLWTALGVVGVAGYPLEVHGEMLGSIGYLAQRVITPDEFEVLGIFADQAAMAIKSAYLFRELARHRERLEVENEYLQDELRLDTGLDNVIGQSPALRSVLRKVHQVSPVETTVLLTGETGTGKELIARAIHEASPRRSRPLIKINCGAIPSGLIESELFGHEKGSFTGAYQQRIGRFELADKGTLFMDEVGELPLETQVKLLRVLQEQEFERVGSTKPMRADVRLISATNRDVEKEVAEGRFRADLFYRLNVFPIRIPPLRERPDDIPLLVDHFLAQFQRKLAKSLKSVDEKSMDQLRRYSWPGNIRELQNVLERACVLSSGPVVSLAEPLRASAQTPAAGGPAFAAPMMTLEESERAHIRRALRLAEGKIHGPKGAADLLGINPSTLRSRMEKLGLSAKG